LGCQLFLADHTKCNDFTDKKCQIFTNAIYNKVIHYCQINAKLIPKLSKCQTAEQKSLQPSSFKIPNLTYLAFENASWQPFQCIGKSTSEQQCEDTRPMLCDATMLNSKIQLQ